MLRVSVVIPTYNRPLELRNCIKSILEQSVKPYEIIVVDDGNLKELPLEKECKDIGVGYIYLKKERPDLTESKNKGAKLAKGDVVFFLDDDVVLFPDYIEEILSAYKSSKIHMVGGVGGINVNRKCPRLRNKLIKILEIVFLVSGFCEGKVLLSGFCVDFGSTGFPIKKIKEVDFLSGGISSFRKEIFKEFSFTDKYRDYAYGEDKDFSYQVSKRYKLIINPNAKLRHTVSSGMRLDAFKRGKMFVFGRYLFFRKHVKKNWWSWGFFYYALFSHIFLRIIGLIVMPSKVKSRYLGGVFSIFKYIIIDIAGVKE